MKQTVVIPVGAKSGRPWAAKVLAYENGKKPVLRFGRSDGPEYGTFKNPVMDIQVSNLEAGDLVYRTTNTRYQKEFCQIKRGPDGLAAVTVGHGPKVRDVFRQTPVLRQTFAQHKDAWLDELSVARVEKFSDLVRAHELIERFLTAGFYMPIPAPRLDAPSSFSQTMLVEAAEHLLKYVARYPEHADFMRTAVTKLSEYKTVRARLVARQMERYAQTPSGTVQK